MNPDDITPTQAMLNMCSQASGLLANAHEVASVMRSGSLQNDDDVKRNQRIAFTLAQQCGVATGSGSVIMTVRQSREFLLLVAKEIIKCLE